jgi:hypothetical protein
MRKLFYLTVLATLISSLCFAAIRRVGYNGISLAGVDFTSIALAQNASAAGDTIQVYNSASGTITKRLVIMGFGYNFDVNAGLQASAANDPSEANISFGVGSDSSVATGLSGAFSVGDQSGSRNPVSNITFLRCSGSFYFLHHESYGPVSDIKIIACVIKAGGMQWNGVNDYPVTNVQVYNSIIYSFNLYKAGSSASIINCVSASPAYASYSVNFQNAGVLVKNSILAYSGAASNINTVYENNFFGDAQPAVLPPGSNNRWSQDWSTLFNRIGGTDNAAYVHDPSFDEDYYVLKAGSPAINGGFNAANQPTNAGIYGGELAYQYKLSGVPAVPAIYKLTAPSSAATTNPYKVTVSIRSNN